MANVVIEQPGVPTMKVAVSKLETGFGRAEDNEVVLVADEVSRHHAKIVRRGDEFLLVDLKSLNGTYVNRQRIVERVLSHEDELWLGGKCRMVFENYETAKTLEDLAGDGQDTQDSTLVESISKIRQELDQVTNRMTMIGGQAPESAPTPKVSADEVQKMSLAFRRLDALYRSSKVIASNFKLNQRLAAVLDTAIECVGAERGFIILRIGQSEDLQLAVAREMGHEVEAGSRAPSMGIARRAAIEGEPVLMIDSGTDKQFGMRESIIRQNIVSAMCAPLQVENRILGSIYVDTSQRTAVFREEDLEMFVALASQSAMAIENVRFYEQMLASEKKRASLGRFLSPAIVDVVMNNDHSLELGGQLRVVTTLFADIRGFTPLSEYMSPEALLELLNEHFTAMTSIVFQYQGTLDKYNGDEVMALFGAPIATPEDPKRAVLAALAMQAKNGELNKERAKHGRPLFEIGIGINTGEVVAGFVGSPERMDFTVLGDHVNTASRLCSAAGAGQVVVGESTYDFVRDVVEAKALGASSLKGKAEQVEAWQILGLKQNKAGEITKHESRKDHELGYPGG